MRFFLVLLMFIAIPFQAQAQSTCDTTALPGRKLVWVGKTLEVGEETLSDHTLYGGRHLEPEHRFAVGAQRYSFLGTYVADYGNVQDKLILRLLTDLESDAISDLQFHVCDDTWDLSAAAKETGVSEYTWSNPGDWSDKMTRKLRLSVPSNNNMDSDQNQIAPELPAPFVGSDTNTSLYVNWDGAATLVYPWITAYALQYRGCCPQTSWASVPLNEAAMREKEAIITRLSPGKTYEIQVKATNSVGAGGWSDSEEIMLRASEPIDDEIDQVDDPMEPEVVEPERAPRSGGGGGGGAPPPLPVEPEPEEEEDVQEEEEMEELELDLKDLIINSEGCSIASADSNDSGFDLLLMVLVVLIPVWWRDQA